MVWAECDGKRVLPCYGGKAGAEVGDRALEVAADRNSTSSAARYGAGCILQRSSVARAPTRFPLRQVELEQQRVTAARRARKTGLVEVDIAGKPAGHEHARAGECERLSSIITRATVSL